MYHKKKKEQSAEQYRTHQRFYLHCAWNASKMGRTTTITKLHSKAEPSNWPHVDFLQEAHYAVILQTISLGKFVVVFWGLPLQM